MHFYREDAPSFLVSTGFRKLFQANPAPVYQADNNGLFPIHIAASIGAEVTIRFIFEKCPSSARLRTAQGRTFLHVAVEDNDGNTGLHLAVQAGKLRMFCSLYRNKEVHLNLPNNSGQTPVDLSRSLVLPGMHYIKSPKKVNLVAKLVRGMRVEDALLQLQVTVKRAAKTLYQVIHSARANAAHNHGLDADKLIVEEAFVGKGLYLKRLSYHAKGRCGVRERPRCRLTVVVREATAEEEAKIAKLRVMNYKKLTRKDKQLMPHRLIEVSPKWARKRKEEEEEAGASA